MSKYLTTIILSIIFINITSVSISVANDIPATTVDGRGVILHDNGTWEFANIQESVELKGPEQAEELVKNHLCSREGTIDQYLTKKAEIPSIKDLGWHVSTKEDGFEVERLLIYSQKIQSKYRWHVYKSGRVTPLNNKAIGITKE